MLFISYTIHNNIIITLIRVSAYLVYHNGDTSFKQGARYVSSTIF